MHFSVISSDGKLLITSTYAFDAIKFLGENVNLDVELAYIF